MTRLTLEEIGRRAGVSRSTVSRVVNDSPSVSTSVRQRVLEVVRETGFQPNQAARSLVMNRTRLLGLVIPNEIADLFVDPYFGRLIGGITTAATATDQTVALFLLRRAHHDHDVLRRVTGSGMVDGIILTSTTVDDPLRDRLVEDGTPLVMVGRPGRPDVPFVDVENRAGARAGTAHLLDHGRRRLGLVAGPSTTTAGLDRRRGFLDAVTAAGLTVRPDRIIEVDFTEESAHRAARRVLTTLPDALFVSSDAMARGVLRAIADAGLDCPRDVAVVSFDGIDESEDRPLTTVVQPVQPTGESAVALLLSLLDQRATRASVDVATDEAPHRVLPTELRLGGTCGCAAA